MDVILILMIGLMYRDGIGIARNFEMARYWWHRGEPVPYEKKVSSTDDDEKSRDDNMHQLQYSVPLQQHMHHIWTLYEHASRRDVLNAMYITARALAEGTSGQPIDQSRTYVLPTPTRGN